jgi:tetratricopeptide (TPR) repeat protein
MTSSPLPEPTGSSLEEELPERTVRANAQEAARLFQRGVAAARGGQKRVAAGLLTRAVKLDPYNEAAWLWLSGVQDDPQKTAFCLQSVLKLNPNNERAKNGLRWLEEQKLVKQGTAPTMRLLEEEDEPARQRDVREQGESWWVNWRQWRRDTRRINLMLWLMPLVAVLVALVMYRSFAAAIEEQRQFPDIDTAAIEDAARAPNMLVPTAVTNQAAVAAEMEVFASAPTSILENQTIAYLNEIEPLRQELRDAVDNYRAITSRPGGSLNHIAAAQELQSTVERVYAIMQEMTPPPDLVEAHETYLTGLELEQAALTDLLEFYGTYRVELVNRAALRFQEANNHFLRARTMFAIRLEQIEQANTVSSHTVR